MGGRCALQQDAAAFHCLDEVLRGNAELLLLAIERGPEVLPDCLQPLKYASKEMRANREVVRASIMKWPRSLREAAEELRGDRQLVLEAVTLQSSALEFAGGYRQSSDDDDGTEAWQDGLTAKKRPAKKHSRTRMSVARKRRKKWIDLKDDFEIVRTAVVKNHTSLQFASPRLQEMLASVECTCFNCRNRRQLQR